MINGCPSCIKILALPLHVTMNFANESYPTPFPMPCHHTTILTCISPLLSMKVSCEVSCEVSSLAQVAYGFNFTSQISTYSILKLPQRAPNIITCWYKIPKSKLKVMNQTVRLHQLYVIWKNMTTSTKKLNFIIILYIIFTNTQIPT